MSLRFKGELCDGNVHMTAKEFYYHKFHENIEKQRIKLKKISSNPVLSDDVKATIRKQLFYLGLLEIYRADEEKRDLKDGR